MNSTSAATVPAEISKRTPPAVHGALPAGIHRVPNRLNACIVCAQIAAIFGCFVAAAVAGSPWAVAGIAAGFALLMVGVFSVIHEAEHGVLFSNPAANTAGGIVMSAFFPGPFHLLRQGHIGHHLRNRSDDEAFDLYFPGESLAWKWIQLLGILTGGFYAMIVLGNLIVLFAPWLLKRRFFAFDRPSAAFIESLNPKYARVIQAEAAFVILLHAGIIWLLAIPPLRYLALYAAFGFTWSAMQYVHHFGTVRDVTLGARNLWIFWPIDKLWLNHNWHLVHHKYPTVSWLHLEWLGKMEGDDRRFLPWAYLKMWAGPRRATESVENRFAGKVIR